MKQVAVGMYKSIRISLALQAPQLTFGLRIEKNFLDGIMQRLGLNFDKFAIRWSGKGNENALLADNGKCLEMNFQGIAPQVKSRPCNDLNEFVCMKGKQPSEVILSWWCGHVCV